MDFKQLAVIVFSALLATAAYSGDKHHAIKVEVESDDADGIISMVLDSEELGFDLHDMQVGENQSVVDKEGRAVLITRTEDGYSFDVDGKTIDMPAFDGLHEDMTFVSDGAFARDVDVDVRVIGSSSGGHHRMSRHAMLTEGGIMIFSGKEIDASTQQIIRDALAASGHDEVNFVGGHDGGPHQVKVIREVVEVID